MPRTTRWPRNRPLRCTNAAVLRHTGGGRMRTASSSSTRSLRPSCASRITWYDASAPRRVNVPPSCPADPNHGLKVVRTVPGPLPDDGLGSGDGVAAAASGREVHHDDAGPVAERQTSAVRAQREVLFGVTTPPQPRSGHAHPSPPVRRAVHQHAAGLEEGLVTEQRHPHRERRCGHGRGIEVGSSSEDGAAHLRRQRSPAGAAMPLIGPQLLTQPSAHPQSMRLR